MMLSNDLKFFSRQLADMKTLSGELRLNSETMSLVELTLEECVRQARHLEAARFQRPPVFIDLSDPKIVLFPIARRPEPVHPSDNGGAA